jgi:hypothetical protein
LIRTRLNKLLTTHYGKIFLVLFLFLALSLISLFVFYNGFLVNFNLINKRAFGENVPRILDHVPYNSFSILLSSLLHPYFLLGLLLIYFPIIFFRRPFFAKKFIYQKPERLLVFGAAFLLTWELVTYDYNYYLDSAFYFDRIVLIILTFALLRFPLLTPLYIAFAFVYRSQFNYPVAGFELFDKRLLFDILLMFVSFRYVKAFIKEFKFSFVWLVLCIVASNYFYTGLAKIIMSPHGYEWLTENNLADLFLNVHVRGWMANASESTINSIWNFLNSWHVPLQFLVLFTELSALFLLRSKKISLIILTVSFLMHLCIFFCGSMLFWKWMAIDALLIYLISKNKIVAEELKYRTLFGSSVVVIAFAFIWLRPYMIGWFDTPVNQYFTYEVVDKNGKVYQLTKNEMNPYHQWFQYDHFLFLTESECLSITGFGYTTNYKLFNQLRTISQNELRLQCRSDHFNPVKTEAYLDFITAYFKNRNKRLGHHLLLTYLRAPYHLHGSGKGLLYADQAAVSKFRVFYNLSFSSSGKTVQIEKRVLHEVLIPE